MSPVEAYLADLRAALGDRLPPSIHEARLREARSHLIASAQDVGEAEAVTRYGRARVVANDLVRAHRGYDARSPWALSWGVGLGVAAAFLLPFLLVRTTSSFGPWQLQAMVWLPFLAVVAFAARCFQTRRWLAVPVVAWAALGMALVFLATTVDDGRRAEPRAVLVARAENVLKTSELDARDAALWRAGRVPTNSVPYAMSRDTVTYVAGLPIPIRLHGEDTYAAERFPTPQSSATGAWKEHGDGWARTAEARLRWARESLASARAGRPLPLAPEDARGPSLLFSFALGQMALVLLGANVLALLMGKSADGAPRRRRRAGA